MRLAWTAIGLSLLLLSGCQSNRTEQPVTTTGGDTPKHGGILNVSISSDPYQWDASFAAGSRGIEYGFSRLLSYGAGPDIGYGEAVLKPEVAERWEASPGGQTFTFHLRRGVKFADIPPVNGRELTAADVKFSLEYAARLGDYKQVGPSQTKDFLLGLSVVDVPDPYTAVVRFSEPSVPFMNYAAIEQLPIMAKEVYQADGHFKDTVIGSGPFQLDRAASQKGTRSVWRKNPTYWESGKPYLDEVRFVIVPDDSTAIAAFQSKQIDALGFDNKIIGYNDAQQIHAKNPAALMGEFEPSMFGVAYLNTRIKPLSDIRVRQAILLAVDNEEMMKTFQGGRGSRLVPGIFNGYFTQDEIKKLMPYDLEKAKRLVAEAYPQGVDVEVTFPQDQTSWHLSFLQLFQAQMKKAGINILLKPIDAAAFSNNRKQGNFVLNIQQSVRSSLRWDPDKGVSRFHSKSDNNYWGINDAVLDQMLDAQRKEVDAAKRRELIRQIGVRIVDQAYSPDFFAALEYSFWQPYVKNVHLNINAPLLPATNVWLDK